MSDLRSFSLKGGKVQRKAVVQPTLAEKRRRFTSSRFISCNYDPIEMQRVWRPVFDRYDHDKDGRIPLEELKVALLAENDFQLHQDVIDEILERADWDKDNFLTYEEFEWMVYAADLGAARPRFRQLVKLAAYAVVPKSERAITVRRYTEEYNCMPPPVFLLFISLAELVMFIYYAVKTDKHGTSIILPVNSTLIYNPYRRMEAWRYVTYMFVHASNIHIAFNVFVQLVLGIPLELVHKWWRVGLVYIAGVVAGSLGTSLADPVSYLVGASGGVYALIAAHLANVVLNFKEMDFRWYRILIITLLAGTDVGVALYNRYGLNEKTRTSYVGHICGALAGFLIGVNCLRNLRVYPWETVLGWAMLVVYAILMLTAIFWNAFYLDYFPKQYI